MIINQSLAFIVRLVLAKILFPEEFGLVGMATVFIGLVQVLNDLGMGSALIQRKSESLSNSHFHTAFWTGVVWSIFLYVLIWIVVAPLASSFYSEPVLMQLIPVLSLGILSSPINLIHKAQLTKAMNFKKMAYIENIASLVAGIVSIVLAIAGAGVWSLAFNSVASIIIAVPLYFRATQWTPRASWNLDAFREIFGFGVYTTGTNVVNYLIGNFDYLVIGRLLDSHALGIYTFAFILTDTFRTRLMSIINKVMYPVYGEKQTQHESLKRYYLTTVNYNSILVFPIMLFMILLGDQFVVGVFGNKWEAAVQPLAILAFAVMIHMMVNSNTSLIRGMGKPKLEFTLQIVKSLIFIPTLYLGIHLNGIIGAAWAVVINKVLAVIIAQYTFNSLLMIKISTKEFMQAVKAPWLAAIISFAIVSLLRLAINNFPLSTLILFGSYGTVIWFLMREEIKKQISFLRS